MSYNQKYKQMESGVAERNYEPKEKVKDILEYPIMSIPDRGITKETCERFGVRTAVDPKDGVSPISYFFPYYDQKGKLCGFKKRDLTLDKNDKGHFTAIGKVGVDCKLFGQQVAESIERQHNEVRIVEGEWDTLSAFQAMVDSVRGTKYEGMEPFVVSVSCGTKNAVESCLHNKDFLTSFGGLTLAFDNDSCTEGDKRQGIMRGAETTHAVAGAMVGVGIPIYVVEYPTNYKDPSDMLQDGKSKELAKLMQFGKKPYSAEKIIYAKDISFDDLLAPKEQGLFIDEFPELNTKMFGFRKRELTLVCAPTNAGKSTITSIFASNFIDKGERVGAIYLEEQVKETMQRILAHRLGVNYLKFKNNPLSVVTEEQLREAYNFLVEENRLLMLDHFGSMPVDDLLNKIRHLHFVDKCSYIILDHISLLMADDSVKDERVELDKVFTKLASFAAGHDVCLIVVSHLNRSIADQFKPPKGKEDEPFWVRVTKESLRGSSCLEQLSWNIIGLEPEVLPNRERGRVRLTILKTRNGYSLGECDVFTLDPETWKVVLSDAREGF